ncbi:N-acetylglucosaminyldiphosphoundecaprenol N-acetyl-beta-D-mannosaminyltransferase [Lactobacillus colini]|uniref:N-acetylglucosaminyldiphosphoundecaprenol N-acetyl-beta-D-mannosaminyltransferase n=1 Tax=Lactobacillus colini TaxID=1819254 RepID=A0ABS4MFP7_9LACO|nr:WecB/TagA/CpsF family glycosyltransferase [Lactobacillus colini]MBP2058423.1 N-acetylglucosaminyldiphosphoundecaprenol N-acetyl-beta-D-mannosaminyltransferase [Lactobacillus colini]
MNKVKVLGIDFDNYSLSEFKNEFISRLNNHLSTMIVTANPEIVMAANQDHEFMEIIQRDADYVTADGIGIVLAGKMQNTPIAERVTGYDLFTWFLHVANLRGMKVYLIGAKPEVITATEARIAQDYPNIKVVGAQDGYFKDDLNTVAQKIELTKPDMVFAAIGFPRQEKLIAIMRRDNLPAMMMGVGGSFDVFSGKVKRAPELFQKSHLEWFYRLITNPTRLKRMMVLPKFVIEVKKNKKR